MKTNRSRQRLLKNIRKELKNSAERLGKSISWFQFAKKTKYGYRFLKNKEKQWEVLKELAVHLAKKHRSYTIGEIVDIVSEMVNAS